MPKTHNAAVYIAGAATVGTVCLFDFHNKIHTHTHSNVITNRFVFDLVLDPEAEGGSERREWRSDGRCRAGGETQSEPRRTCGQFSS